MRTLLATLIICALTASAFGADGEYTRLTTNMLEKTSVVLDRAGNSRDSKTLLAHLASNVVITVSFPEHPEVPEMTFTKQTYAEHIKKSWANAKAFSSHRIKTAYEIAPSGQSATATATFRQSVTMKDTGRVLTTVGQQVSTIELIDGVPQARRIDTSVTFK